ncbi:TolC family protein [Chitinophaga sancti]|uniref:Outer membrane protein TolC n=1 Tax=Chitinophaga sancti TaxID=1004 RepID=A0A1K1SFC5_9BACT|nr:TolC family protein [Chitinophaga sancti]WQD59813.1 TolC family protein [Chitinophaga sancti]WQG88056.1 TolC family protein [Chitinophaga sancti]SFW83083.1 Outer membrane protein TolC [Chitinophaga sancti]
MKYIIKYILLIILGAPLQLVAQQVPVLPLDTVLQRVDRNNILLQSYGLKAESYKYSADAATAWMAPMVGIGTFMTPYPGQTIMDSRDKGSLMLQLEQDIPNPAKLNAKKKFIASQGNVEKATRDITLNDLKAQARRLYFNWLVARQRIVVLRENEKIMTTMKKIEEVRYPYNQSQLSGVFKANAKIEDNHNMIRMQEGTIAKARSWLNSLMNAPGNQEIEIDTTYQPVFEIASSYDTATLAASRKDIIKMNESIHSMQLNIESMKKEKKPDFKFRFDHMYPLYAMMPKAFSAMGMISIPIAPWSSKMYKSGVKAMEYNVQAMEKERAAMLQETQGMLYGMQYEIQSMQKRIEAMESKIIPALRQTLDANFLNYQENKLALSNVIDSWEALSMMQSNVLDEKLKLYEMIADYEKQLYR